MDMKTALQRVLDGQDLAPGEMKEVMRLMMSGVATPVQIGGFLVGLRAKVESVDELVAAAQVMRELATKVPVDGPHLIDTCGTGGDASHTFNISTTCAFVVAAAGGKVAKHGNRSVSSCCGSADVLEAAGVYLDLAPDQVRQCIEQVGVGFLFAPRHHGAMKHAVGPRRELGVRTIFNLLGPLTNPAGARHQLVGVYNETLVDKFARVLLKLGSEHVLVVNAEDGLDEISLAAPTRVAELREGRINHYTIYPEQFGMERVSLRSLWVDSAAASLKLMLGVLDGQHGPARDIVLLNAGAAIYAADLVDTLARGIAKAAEAIDSGAARQKLQALIDFTRSFQEA
ncbi:MAG: anthranilate phosphoribosyltransferase [Methylococcaceae bacterium]|nr:MAG: anthranilate phosphoribosyltransferase [Methylococcaceae bacterium]